MIDSSFNTSIKTKVQELRDGKRFSIAINDFRARDVAQYNLTPDAARELRDELDEFLNVAPEKPKEKDWSEYDRIRVTHKVTGRSYNMVRSYGDPTTYFSVILGHMKTSTIRLYYDVEIRG